MGFQASDNGFAGVHERVHNQPREGGFNNRDLMKNTLLPIALLLAASLSAADWPQFRGPNGDARSDDSQVPLKWSATENLKWKAALPGAGSSSPIITGNKVIVTCYSGQQENGDVSAMQRHIVCFDKSSGAKLWQKDYLAGQPEDPYQGMIVEHGYASNTPVTDGKNVYAHLGKGGVVALDLDGKELWKAPTGKESNMRRWGSGGSPILWHNLMIINASDEAQSLMAFDKATGKLAWKQTAGLLDLSFGSPRLLKRKNGAEELVFAAPNELWGLNPETGKLRWYVETGLNGNVSPDAVFADDLICVFGGYPATGRVAIRLADDNKADVVWRDNNSSYVPTPVVREKHIYWVSDQGFANAIEAASGKAIYKERLGGGSQGRGRGKPFYASQILVGDRVYAVSRRQGTFVLAAKPTFEVLATNVIEGDNSDFNATPAVSDGCLYLRSNQALYCVGQ